MKFRCLITKNVVEFFEEVDIKSMLEHPQYEVVKDEEKLVEKKPVKTKE